MNWTTHKPTEPGYYWWRKNKYKFESIYYVFFNVEESITKENKTRLDELSRYSSIYEVSPENRVLECRWAHKSLYDKQRIEDMDGEWFGPITPPTDEPC